MNGFLFDEFKEYILVHPPRKCRQEIHFKKWSHIFYHLMTPSNNWKSSLKIHHKQMNMEYKHLTWKRYFWIFFSFLCFHLIYQAILTTIILSTGTLTGFRCGAVQVMRTMSKKKQFHKHDVFPIVNAIRIQVKFYLFVVVIFLLCCC